MYKLLRPHHSIFLGNDEQYYNQFLKLCEDNPHITMLFGTNGNSDVLFQWRLAFNTWIFLQTPEDELYEHSERVMFYPTVQFILQYFKKVMPITVFKNNYSKVELLVFLTALSVVDGCIRWYESIQEDQNMTKAFSETLMETDFYQIFKKNDASGDQPLPKVLLQSIVAVFKDFKQKIESDEQQLLKVISNAINESKKMHSFFEEVSY